ncbi:MAG: CDC27 family protein [candidate division WOR-3 bacterium]
MLLIAILNIQDIENYLKKRQINLAIEELKNLRTEADFKKAYYLFLKYNANEIIVIKIARSLLENEDFMLNEAFEYYYKKEDLRNAILELCKSKDENYIYYQLMRLYSDFASGIYREIDKCKNNESFKKGIFKFFLMDNKLEMALRYASNISDTLAIANSYYENGNYNKVIELLKNKTDNFSRRLYGLALYKTERFEEASKILEKLEPETSAICYMRIKNFQKALILTKDTSKIITSLFELKKYADVIKLCNNDFYKECFLSYLYVQNPESVINYFKKTFPNAKYIDPDIALYIEILNTYENEQALNFFYILKGENKSLNDKNLENLAYGIYFERIGETKKAINYYKNITDGWLKPFVLYKLYILTKSQNYKNELITSYPSSVYAEIIRDK